MPLNTGLLLVVILLLPSVLLQEQQAPSSESSANSQGRRNLNVLMIVIDDFRYAFSTSFGQLTVRTPNIDQFKSSALVLDEAHCQFPLCGPSRASFLTGRRPDTTRVYSNGGVFRISGGNFTTLPQYFKQNGYKSIGMGKIFHPGVPLLNDDPISWSVPYYHAPDEYYWSDLYWGGNISRQGAYRPITPDVEALHPLEDKQLTEKAIETLQEQRNSTQPFFLAVGHHKPHLPHAVPISFYNQYPQTFPLAPNQNVPSQFPPIGWSGNSELFYYLDVAASGATMTFNNSFPLALQKNLIQGYYAATTYIDAEVGKLLAALDATGFSRNTVVVLMADHGWHLGQHGNFAKQTLFSESTRVPLYIRVPGYSGGRTAQLVELVDVYPTLADLVGLPVPPVCPENSHNFTTCTEGISFKQLFSNPLRSWKDAVFTQVTRSGAMGYTVVPNEPHVRYTEWVGFSSNAPIWDQVFARELYIHDLDPQENQNVVSDPQYASLVQDLSNTLHAGWRTAVPHACSD